ncbi:MAG: hypothetical protein MZV63_40255 [Marinilabiliales bacterium]|nr:hypothetical protein [Marinilabiliales bacterium]
MTDTAGLVSKPMEVIVTVRRPLILDPGTVVVGPVIPTPIDPVVIRPTGVLTRGDAALRRARGARRGRDRRRAPRARTTGRAKARREA